METRRTRADHKLLAKGRVEVGMPVRLDVIGIAVKDMAESRFHRKQGVRGVELKASTRGSYCNG